MLKSIEEACRNFCIHQIRKPHEIIDGISKMRTLIAYIDVDTIYKKKYRVYIASSLSFMQEVAYVFIEENESDEETLIDMTLETANLIVGSAKVIADELGENPFTIGTPSFLKFDLFDFAYDEAKTVRIKGDEISMAIKEING